MTRDVDAQTVVRNVTLLFVLGFVCRILLAELFLGGLDRAYEGDEGGYTRMALRLVAGMGFVDSMGDPTSFLPPGLPLFIAMPVSLVGPNLAVLRLLMCLIESLLIPACYLLAKSVSSSPKLGLVAGAIAVFFPTWIIPSGIIMTDIPEAILVTLTAGMAIEGYRRKSLLWIAGSGLVWGSATLVRAVSLSYAPAIVLWLLLVIPGWKMRLASVAIVLISFAAVVAPWSIRNTYVHGTFVLMSTMGGSELLKANNPNATGILFYDFNNFHYRYTKEQYPNEATRSNLHQADAIKFILQNPRRFAELCFIRFIELWKLYSPRILLIENLVVIASFGVAVPFFLIQVIRCGWRRDPAMLLLFIIICHTAVHVVYPSIVRYRIPIEPLVVVMAIQGFYWSFGRIKFALKQTEDREIKARLFSHYS